MDKQPSRPSSSSTPVLSPDESFDDSGYLSDRSMTLPPTDASTPSRATSDDSLFARRLTNDDTINDSSILSSTFEPSSSLSVLLAIDVNDTGYSSIHSPLSQSPSMDRASTSTDDAVFAVPALPDNTMDASARASTRSSSHPPGISRVSTLLIVPSTSDETRDESACTRDGKGSLPSPSVAMPMDKHTTVDQGGAHGEEGVRSRVPTASPVVAHSDTFSVIELGDDEVQERKYDRNFEYWTSNDASLSDACPICGVKVSGVQDDGDGWISRSSWSRRNHYLRYHYDSYYSRIDHLGAQSWLGKFVGSMSESNSYYIKWEDDYHCFNCVLPDYPALRVCLECKRSTGKSYLYGGPCRLLRHIAKAHPTLHRTLKEEYPGVAAVNGPVKNERLHAMLVATPAARTLKRKAEMPMETPSKKPCH